jgi:hypothetical protein
MRNSTPDGSYLGDRAGQPAGAQSQAPSSRRHPFQAPRVEHLGCLQDLVLGPSGKHNDGRDSVQI